MSGKEPRYLKEWTSGTGRLFTCGRPGRAACGKHSKTIPDEVVRLWADGVRSVQLAQSLLHVVSLLGEKFDGGKSEFSFYSFRSEHEVSAKPTFQEWLDAAYPSCFVVHEFPTADGRPHGIPRDCVLTIIEMVERLLSGGHVVVVVDSGGVERTGQVCRAMGRSEILRSPD